MEAHRQSTADIGTLAGIMARQISPKKRVQPSAPAKPRIQFLQRWRKHRKLSQEKLAAMVGLTQGMISQLETGSTDYTGTHLQGLARALDCTDIDLLRHDPTKSESPYTLIESMDADDRNRAVEILKAIRRTT